MVKVAPLRGNDQYGYLRIDGTHLAQKWIHTGMLNTVRQELHPEE